MRRQSLLLFQEARQSPDPLILFRSPAHCRYRSRSDPALYRLHLAALQTFLANRARAARQSIPWPMRGSGSERHAGEDRCSWDDVLDRLTRALGLVLCDVGCVIHQRQAERLKFLSDRPARVASELHPTLRFLPETHRRAFHELACAAFLRRAGVRSVGHQGYSSAGEGSVLSF